MWVWGRGGWGMGGEEWGRYPMVDPLESSAKVTCSLSGTAVHVASGDLQPWEFARCETAALKRRTLIMSCGSSSGSMKQSAYSVVSATPKPQNSRSPARSRMTSTSLVGLSFRCTAVRSTFLPAFPVQHSSTLDFLFHTHGLRHRVYQKELVMCRRCLWLKGQPQTPMAVAHKISSLSDSGPQNPCSVSERPIAGNQ